MELEMKLPNEQQKKKKKFSKIRPLVPMAMAVFLDQIRIWFGYIFVFNSLPSKNHLFRSFFFGRKRKKNTLSMSAPWWCCSVFQNGRFFRCKHKYFGTYTYVYIHPHTHIICQFTRKVFCWLNIEKFYFFFFLFKLKNTINKVIDNSGFCFPEIFFAFIAKNFQIVMEICF